MTKSKNALKKTILTALATAAVINSMKAEEEAEKAPEDKLIKMEEKISTPKWLITDENGNFDEKVVSDAFSKMRYEEKIPQVQEIYKDATKNGFSDKHVDQLTKLFGGDKAMGESIKRALEDAKKSEKLNNLFYGMGTALACAGLLAFVLSVINAYKKGIVYDEETSYTIGTCLLAGIVLLPVCLYQLKAQNVDSIIKSEKRMEETIVEVQKAAFKEYKKQPKHIMVEPAPGVLESKIAEEKASYERN